MKIFFCISLLFYSLVLSAQNNPIKTILQKMYDAEDKLYSAKFTLYSAERLKDGKMFLSERFIKLKMNPKKIYFYSVKPNPGTEIIWKEGWNENKMLVSPGSFPYVTFSMKPNNSIARKDSHHPITDTGFEYVTSLVKYYQETFGEKFYKYISIADTVMWDNHSCILLIFDFKEYAEVNYKVLRNEDILTIAKKFHLNDYSIMILNPSINDFEDVKVGQIIKIPNFYGRKIEFYVDRKTGLPLKQLIYDQKGLLEKYEMKSFILNPSFKPEEFTPEYKDYRF